MAIYNAYLEGAEREAAILNMELSNQYEKLSMLYEMASMELEMAKKDIELKVFKESGTYDDYEYLISEAEAQAAEDQTNIVSRILKFFADAIQKAITGIKNFFNGSKDIPADTEANVSVPEDAEGLFNTINSVLDQVAAADKIDVKTIITIAGSAIGLGSIGTILANLNQKHKWTRKLMKFSAFATIEKLCNTYYDKFMGFVKTIQGKLDKIPFFQGFSDNFLEPVRKKVEEIRAGLDQGLQEFKKVAGGAVDKVKGVVTGNNGETQPQQPAQPQQQTGPASVNSATPDKGNSRIKVSYMDNSTGTPVQKTAYVNPSGKVIGNKSSDGTAIPAAIKNAIQTSQPVKDAMTAIANNISNNAMQNSPQAQLATGTQVNTAKQNAAAQNAANQKAQKKAAQQKAKAEKNRVKAENNAMQNSPNAQFINNESVEAIREELGENYTVEIAEDGVLEITVNTVLEMPKNCLSVTQSIFGMIAEEEANEDPELNELIGYFSSL